MNPDDNDAWDLATLAAQVLRRRNSPSEAVDAAWSLFEAAKHKLESVQLEAFVHSPEGQAQSDKEEAERLASLKIAYEKGVKIITSHDRRDRALRWFKRFLAAKAQKERAPKEREAWVEAQLSNYKIKGFTGTEASKLRAEFKQWRQSEKVNKAA